MSELLLARARIKGLETEIAALRAIISERRMPLEGGDCEVDPERPKWAECLTFQQWSLLSSLIAAEGAVVSNAELLDVHFGSAPDDEAGLKAMRVMIHHIRKQTHEKLIETAHGRGYRYRADYIPAA